jgi:hypothetical protein
MTAHLPFILLALCAASSSAAAPPVVIAIEALGLTAEEEGALAGTLQRGVREQQLEPVMLAGPLPEGCVGDRACLDGILTPRESKVLLVVQAMRAGGSLQLTEQVASPTSTALMSEAIREEVTGAIGEITLAPATTAALAAFQETTPTAPAPMPPAQGDGLLGLGLALRADLAMLHGRTFGVTIAEPSLRNTLSGEGIKGFGGGVLLQLSWNMPIDGHVLNRAFGVEFDVGYTVSGENGTVPFTQYETKNGATALVTTNYDYSGVIHIVPMSLGLHSRLPLADLGLPVSVDVAAGGNALWGVSVASAAVQGEGVAFATDNTASDVAFGFYLETGVAWKLGPGELVGSYRYVSSYLDFGHADFNTSPGDLGGHHLLVGYRFTL